MKRPRYKELASRLDAYNRCVSTGNHGWEVKHKEWLDREMRNAPSGSGIDCGTKLDFDASTPEKLVFTFSYHHMDGESGMYTHWTSHVLTVTASLIHTLDLGITFDDGDEDDLGDYLHDVYYTWLTEEVDLA